MRKEARLAASKDFEIVYRKGRAVKNKEFVLYILKKESPGLRIGISVSRKIGPAVVRNRIKRLIREAFRRNETVMERGYDLVLIARRAAREKSFHEVEKAFIDVITKAGLFRGKGRNRDEKDTNRSN
jgi:ribonuclease P protein component